MGYRLLADLIVAAHVAWVAFVVLGQVAIVAGVLLRQSWARAFWFRVVHLAMIALVVLESWLDLPCPLTVWERGLRARAGQATYAGDFLGYWMHRVIFFRAEPWAFTLIYTLFGLAVAATFVLAPPRRPGRREEARS